MNKRLAEKIRIEARQRGLAHEQDDVVQEILCRMLEGRHAKAKISYMVLDYLREDIGRRHTLKERLARPVLYDEKTDPRSYQGHNQMEARVELTQLLSCLNKYELLLVELYYLDGYLLEELVQWFGFSGRAGVEYQLGVIREKLKARRCK